MVLYFDKPPILSIFYLSMTHGARPPAQKAAAHVQLGQLALGIIEILDAGRQLVSSDLDKARWLGTSWKIMEFF